MKKLFLFAALFVATTACAQHINVRKQTEVYAVKDADTLRMDRYSAITLRTLNHKPCLVFVFGGGFVSGTRDNTVYKPYFEYYAQQGWEVVSIDYRLGLKKAMQSGALNSPEGFQAAWMQTLAMAVEDFYDATAYILSNAAKWGVNPQQIVASGSSAGAITVLMGEYGICNGSALALHLPKDFNYAGVISYAGAIFAAGDELEWKQKPAPLMLFHGDADRNVPYDAVREWGAGFFGSKYIAQQLTEKRLPHWFYSVSNDNHSLATRPMTENRYEIDAFLEKFVIRKQQLMIDTSVVPTDLPDAQKVFTLSDYIKANFGN